MSNCENFENLINDCEDLISNCVNLISHERSNLIRHPNSWNDPGMVLCGRERIFNQLVTSERTLQRIIVTISLAPVADCVCKPEDTPADTTNAPAHTLSATMSNF